MSSPEPDTEPRFFSFDEANRTLPLVRRIVEDITTAYAALEPELDRLRSLPRDARSTGEARELRARVKRQAAAVDELVAELHELGCHFKGFGDGLVDWYSYYAGRPVFLCWRLGEPEIGWWHQTDAGFLGRQPILDGQREAFRAER